MLQSISATQFAEWQEFSGLEPFDAERDDLRMAALERAWWNLHRDHEKQPEPWPLAMFQVRFGDTPPYEPPKMTPQDQTNQWKRNKAALWAWAHALADVPGHLKMEQQIRARHR